MISADLGDVHSFFEGGTCILMITVILESWDKVGRDACGPCRRGDPGVPDKNRPQLPCVNHGCWSLPSCSKELRGMGGSCFIGLFVELIDVL